MKKDIVLALFFTKGVSLQSWEKSGLLYREKILYEYLLEKNSLKCVIWFTYGRDDPSLAQELYVKKILHKRIRIVAVPRFFSGRFGQLIYSLVSPIYHYKIINEVHILKSNQVYGAWTPLIAKYIFSKPFIMRCGYIPSVNSNFSKFFLYKPFFQFIERLCFKFSDLSLVSNSFEYNFIRKKYKLNNIKINPSYTNTATFYKKRNINKINNKRIMYVGRLEDVKNVVNTIEGVLGAGFSIDIYGDGALKEKIKLKFKDYIKKNRVSLKGVIPNNKLGHYYRKYTFYILVSLSEGMSKTLSEAMSCGLVCIVSNIPQNKRLVVDKVTGILVKGTNVRDIETALKNLNKYNLSDISKNASEFIHNNFSLDISCDKELNFVNSVLK